jgi:hypothetical protein
MPGDLSEGQKRLFEFYFENYRELQGNVSEWKVEQLQLFDDVLYWRNELNKVEKLLYELPAIGKNLSEGLRMSKGRSLHVYDLQNGKFEIAVPEFKYQPNVDKKASKVEVANQQHKRYANEAHPEGRSAQQALADLLGIPLNSVQFTGNKDTGYSYYEVDAEAVKRYQIPNSVSAGELKPASLKAREEGQLIVELAPREVTSIQREVLKTSLYTETAVRNWGSAPAQDGTFLSGVSAFARAQGVEVSTDLIENALLGTLQSQAAGNRQYKDAMKARGMTLQASQQPRFEYLDIEGKPFVSRNHFGFPQPLTAEQINSKLLMGEVYDVRITENIHPDASEQVTSVSPNATISVVVPLKVRMNEPVSLHFESVHLQHVEIAQRIRETEVSITAHTQTVLTPTGDLIAPSRTNAEAMELSSFVEKAFNGHTPGMLRNVQQRGVKTLPAGGEPMPTRSSPGSAATGTTSKGHDAGGDMLYLTLAPTATHSAVINMLEQAGVPLDQIKVYRQSTGASGVPGSASAVKSVATTSTSAAFTTNPVPTLQVAIPAATAQALMTQAKAKAKAAEAELQAIKNQRADDLAQQYMAVIDDAFNLYGQEFDRSRLPTLAGTASSATGLPASGGSPSVTPSTSAIPYLREGMGVSRPPPDGTSVKEASDLPGGRLTAGSPPGRAGNTGSMAHTDGAGSGPKGLPSPAPEYVDITGAKTAKAKSTIKHLSKKTTEAGLVTQLSSDFIGWLGAKAHGEQKMANYYYDKMQHSLGVNGLAMITTNIMLRLAGPTAVVTKAAGTVVEGTDLLRLWKDGDISATKFFLSIGSSVAGTVATAMTETTLSDDVVRLACEKIAKKLGVEPKDLPNPGLLVSLYRELKSGGNGAVNALALFISDPVEKAAFVKRFEEKFTGPNVPASTIVPAARTLAPSAGARSAGRR